MTGDGAEIAGAAQQAYRRQVRQARGVAGIALARYGLAGARLRLLAHRGTTLFQVDAPDGRFVLRVYRAGGSSDAHIRSELAWLGALRRDTDLTVPEPVAARDGALLITAVERDGAEAHRCVLFRWVAGRFVDRGLTPAHLRRVGAFLAGLHAHTAYWIPPPGFTRPHWDWRALFAPGAVAGPGSGAGWLTPAAHAVFAAAAIRIAGEMATLEAGGAEHGLIHADFQQTNYLFHRGAVRAIDFADCCWGYYAYDMAIPLFEVADRPRGAVMHAAFLDEYAAVRPLPADAAPQIRLFTALRLIKRVNYLARVGNPTLRSQAPYWLGYTVDWLRRWL